MTVIPVNSDASISMGFADEDVPVETSIEVEPVQELVENLLLLGFMGGLRRIQDECSSLKAEHDILMGIIDQEELAEVMTTIDESYAKSQEDIDKGVELVEEFLEQSKIERDEQ